MNKFLQLIQELSLPNKYTRWYIQIISNANNSGESYTERHHILPKSFAKDLDIENINDKENLANLTAKQHYVCHMLLARMFTGKFKRKIAYALHRLVHSNNSEMSDYYVSSRHYDYVRKQHSANLSGNGNPMFGKTHSEETREKISKKATGRKASKELREYFSTSRKGEGNSMYGRKHTEETRHKMSKSRKGKCAGAENSFYGKTHSDEIKMLISSIRKSEPRIECQYCGKITSKLNNIRWHGFKCKNYLTFDNLDG